MMRAIDVHSENLATDIATIMSNIVDSVIARGPDAIDRDFQRRLTIAIARRYVAAGDIGAIEARREIGGIERKSDDFRAERIRQAQQRAAEKVVGISNRIKLRLREIIADATARGQGPRDPDLRAAIIAAMQGEAGKSRAERIASTELHSVAIGAKYEEILRQKREFGGEYQKTWRSTRDGRTRTTHKRANNQVRELEEPFDVGLARLRYPGDPNGPAREVIRCRCAMNVSRRRAETTIRFAPGRSITAGGNTAPITALPRGFALTDPQSITDLIAEAAIRVAEARRVGVAFPAGMSPQQMARLQRRASIDGRRMWSAPNGASSFFAAIVAPFELVSDEWTWSQALAWIGAQ